MDELLYSLLCKKRRRRMIMQVWQLHQPVAGETLFEVLYGFVKTVLYERIEVALEETGLQIFTHERGFAIPYRYMTKDEQELVFKMYKQRATLFAHRRRYINGHWVLKGYKWKRKERARELWPQRYRREMIRDFVHFVLSRDKPWVLDVKWEIIGVVQLLIEKEQRRSDEFLRNLHNGLQGIGNINELMVVYN